MAKESYFTISENGPWVIYQRRPGGKVKVCELESGDTAAHITQALNVLLLAEIAAYELSERDDNGPGASALVDWQQQITSKRRMDLMMANNLACVNRLGQLAISLCIGLSVMALLFWILQTFVLK